MTAIPQRSESEGMAMGMFLRFLVSACLCLELLTSVGLGQSPTLSECPVGSQETESGPHERPLNHIRFRHSLIIREPLRIGVTFIGETALDAKELADIAKSLEEHVYQDSEWTHELAERARAEWQNRGYFKALVKTTDPKLLSETPDGKDLSLTISVNAGRRYRLASMSFQDNNVFSSSELRAMFPIEVGYVVDVRKIQQGLESIRKAYSVKGFVNVAAIPTFAIDDASSTISVMFEFDEGKKFAFNQIKVLGLDPQLAQTLLRESGLEKGKTFDPWLLDNFIQRNRALLPQNAAAESDIYRKFNDNDGTIDITMDFRRCAASPK
jgi:outer membrane translocation and assembly module TamA